MHRVGSGVAIPKDFLGILYSIYNYFFSNKGNLVKVLALPRQCGEYIGSLFIFTHNTLFSNIIHLRIQRAFPYFLLKT